MSKCLRRKRQKSKSYYDSSSNSMFLRYLALDQSVRRIVNYHHPLTLWYCTVSPPFYCNCINYPLATVCLMTFCWQLTYTALTEKGDAKPQRHSVHLLNSVQTRRDGQPFHLLANRSNLTNVGVQVDGVEVEEYGMHLHLLLPFSPLFLIHPEPSVSC